MVRLGDYTEITCDPPVTGQHIVVFTDPGQYLEVCELEAFSGKTMYPEIEDDRFF